MSNSNDLGGCLGCLTIIVGLIALYFFVVYIVFPTVVVASSSGILFGGGISLRNYMRSFKKNVAFETV